MTDIVNCELQNGICETKVCFLEYAINYKKKEQHLIQLIFIVTRTFKYMTKMISTITKTEVGIFRI